MNVSKILIVEDDADLSRALSLRIKAAGFEVVAARDALQATSLWRKEKPSLIIMDVRMPAGDGFRVHEALNEQPDFLVPIIYVTGNAQEADEDRARKLGGVGFFRKPVDPDRLIECIRAALKSYPSKAEAEECAHA